MKATVGMCNANGDPVCVDLDVVEVVIPSAFSPGAIPRFIDQFDNQLKLDLGHVVQI